MTDVGDERRFCDSHDMSAVPPTAVKQMRRSKCSDGPIVLQNSKGAGLQIFRENLKREAIADSYNRNRVGEVACEFNAKP